MLYRMLDMPKAKDTTEWHWSQKANMWKPFVRRWNPAAATLTFHPAGPSPSLTSHEVKKLRDLEPTRAVIVTVTVVKVLMKANTFVGP